MIVLKAYRIKTIRYSKYGEELSDDDAIGLMANIMRSGSTEEKEILVYTSAGETKEEAQKSLDNYLKSIDFCYKLSRIEEVSQ